MSDLQTIHKRKIHPEFFDAVADGSKTFEIRREEPNEEPFRLGDGLLLEEWDPARGEYTGRSCFRHIAYLLRDKRFVLEGTVVLGLFPTPVHQMRAENARLREKLVETEAARDRAFDKFVQLSKGIESGIDKVGGMSTPPLPGQAMQIPIVAAANFKLDQAHSRIEILERIVNQKALRIDELEAEKAQSVKAAAEYEELRQLLFKIRLAGAEYEISEKATHRGGTHWEAVITLGANSSAFASSSSAKAATEKAWERLREYNSGVRS